MMRPTKRQKPNKVVSSSLKNEVDTLVVSKDGSFTTTKPDANSIGQLGQSYFHPSSYHDFLPEEIAHIRKDLLSWYHSARRKLPWRGDTVKPAKTVKQSSDGEPDCQHLTVNSKHIDAQESITSIEDIPTNSLRTVTPYETWVSEIMLQQTRVETVIAYFNRWMARLPSIKHLAEASDELVNSLWSGLGYYRRARLLHLGAKHVVQNYGGQLPNTVDALKKIPGIGPYTAGAIASIAFSRPVPLVDGNVIRVIARLRAIANDSKSPRLIKHCWKVTADLVDPDEPGSFNQALMELGATVCTPAKALCSRCPIRSHCNAYDERNGGSQAFSQQKEDYLTISKGQCGLCQDTLQRGGEMIKKFVDTQDFAVFVISSSRNGETEYLFKKRPNEGLLAGQYEFPNVEIDEKSGAEDFASCGDLWRSKLNLPRTVQAISVGSILHVFSHIKHRMHVFAITLTRRRPSPSSAAECLWMTEEKAYNLGLTVGMRKVLKLASTSGRETTCQKQN